VSHYDEKPGDLIQDTKDFLKSEYGQYFISILEDTAEGYLAEVANIKARYPERYAAKYSALKEVLALINSPLDDDTPLHG
jgi:hypothetical protein